MGDTTERESVDSLIKQPKVLNRICYSIAASIVLLILMILIIVSELIIKFLT